MKYLTILILACSPSWAQELPLDQPIQSTPKQVAIEKIFSALSPEELPAALENARKLGVNQQVIIEAHFLHLVDQEDFKAIAKFAPELVKQRDLFNPDQSEIFAVKEDWLAIVHYAQALGALEKNEKASFKKHITEAFWLSPRQGQAFAPHINRLRMEEEMKAITLKQSHPLTPQDGGETTTLGKLMKGKKAAVLHFWSPMSQEVHQNLENFIKTSQSCNQHNIASISILVGQTPMIIKDAELMRKEDLKDAGCSWIIDPLNGSLSNLLRITEIPTMVIITTEGKIIFNGHPSDEKFWDQLKKIDSTFEQPAQMDSNHNHSHCDG